jgi:hypothetical protein
MKYLIILSVFTCYVFLSSCSKEDRQEVKKNIDSASNTLNKELDTLVNTIVNKDSVFENAVTEKIGAGGIASEDLRKKLNDIFDSYEDIKDELADDDTSGVQKAALELQQAIIRAQRSAAADKPDSKWKLWLSDIEKITSELTMTETLAEQRELFSDLTTSVNSMITQFGLHNKTIYKITCSKINKSWFTESKELDNPYYGKDDANSRSDECAQVDKAWEFES